MVHCIDCEFWSMGCCDKIEEDGVDHQGGARIKVTVLDDSGLEVNLRTSGSFGCVLGVAKPLPKKKVLQPIESLQDLKNHPDYQELQRKVDEPDLSKIQSEIKTLEATRQLILDEYSFTQSMLMDVKHFFSIGDMAQVQRIFNGKKYLIAIGECGDHPDEVDDN